MASSAAPPLIPISTPTTSTFPSSSTANPQPPPATFGAVLRSVAGQIRDGVSRSRPWSELADRSAFAQPGSLTDAASRLRRNYSYFRLNYLLLVSVVLAFSLLSHPFCLLLLLALLSAWTFLYLLRPSDQPLVLLGRSFSDRETLGVLVAVTAFVVFLTSVGSVLISAVLVGSAAVCAHGAFRVPDDLFLDQQAQAQAQAKAQRPPSSAGFLSFAAKNAAQAAPSIIAAARV